MTRTGMVLTAAIWVSWTVATGCLKSTHRLDGDVHLALPGSSWAVPLAEMELSTDDLPLDFVEGLEVSGAGHAYVWRKALDPIALGSGDWMDWPDWERNVAIGLDAGTVAALNALPAGADAEVEVAEALPFEAPAGAEVARVVFAGGTLRCVPQPVASLGVEAALTLPELHVGGAPLTWSVGSQAVEIDLAGAEWVLPAGQTEVHLNALVTLTTTGTPVPSNATLGWSLEWQDAEWVLFEGRLGPQDPLELTGEWDVAAPAWLEGAVGLAAPRIALEVENGQGVEFDLGFSGQIHSHHTAQPFTWHPASTATIAPATQPGAPTISTFAVDNGSTTPSIGTWLTPATTGLSYTATASVATDDQQFLTADGSIRLTPSVEVPFTGYAARLAHRDTVAVDLAAILATQLPPPLTTRDISRITLRFETSNGLPFSLATQVRFLDAAGLPVDSLFVDATTTLEAASTTLENGVYVPVQPGLRTWDAVFDGELAWELAEAGVQAMAVELVGCTPGAADERPVAFGPGQTVSLRAALRVDAQWEQP